MTQTVRALILCSIWLVPLLARADCASWQSSFADWDKEAERIVGGEFESVLAPVTRLLQAKRQGETLPSEDVVRGFAKRRAELERLGSPLDLATFHRRVIDYLAAAERFASWVGTTGEDLRGIEEREIVQRPAVRDAYRSLLDLYRELASLLRSHGCNGGDVEELEGKRIPELERLLAGGAEASRPITRK